MAEKSTTTPKSSTVTADVEADVEQTGTTNRTVNVDRETEVDVHWWGADFDETKGAPVRLERGEREIKYARPSSVDE